MTPTSPAVTVSVLADLALHFAAGVALALILFTACRLAAIAVLRLIARPSLTASPSTAAGTPGANGAAVLSRPTIRAAFFGGFA